MSASGKIMGELMDGDDNNMPGSKHKLYELDGLPIRFGSNPNAFPERLNPATKQWEICHDMTKIAYDGSKVSQQEFQQMVDAIMRA